MECYKSWSPGHVFKGTHAFEIKHEGKGMLGEPFVHWPKTLEAYDDAAYQARLEIIEMKIAEKSPGVMYCISPIAKGHRMRLNPNTAYRRTVAYELFGPALRHPANLRNQEGYDPLVDGAFGGGPEVQPFEDYACDLALKVVTRQILANLPANRPPLDERIGVLGRPGYKYFRPMDMKTSSGYPYNTMGYNHAKAQHWPGVHSKVDYDRDAKMLIIYGNNWIPGDLRDAHFCDEFADEMFEFRRAACELEYAHLIHLYPVQDVLKDELRQ
jgi:hypothetical protein